MHAVDVAEGLSVHIVGTETVKRSHTNYIALCCIGTSRWEVRKRYSEFEALHKSLKAIKGSSGLASLPKKVLFGKLSEAVVRQRQEGLNTYINALLHCSNQHRRLLMAFLQAPTAAGWANAEQNSSAAASHQAHQVWSNNTGLQQTGGGVVEYQDHENLHDSRDQMVELVADKMIDAFQVPVPVKGRDAQNRREAYEELIQTSAWANGGSDGGPSMMADVIAATSSMPQFAPGGLELGPPLSATEDGVLTSALKQVTTAAKIGLTVKEPFVIRMGDFAIDEEQ